MAKKVSKPQTETDKRSTLLMSRAEAEKKIQDRIEVGKQLHEASINTNESLDKARAEYRKWTDYNSTLLQRLVDTNELERDYNPSWGMISLGPSSLSEQIVDFQLALKSKIERLESILGRLELIPESGAIPQVAVGSQEDAMFASNRVFVVHGHDEEAKQSVARCIERLGLEAVILHEQANQGRTIIEKFENYSDVGFAVVLLTPDDVGSTKANANNLVPRARQNVILELGFFIGKLGRNRVCALHKGNVEIPSDFSGVLYERMDEGGAWRFALGRELRSVGIQVDLNKLI